MSPAYQFHPEFGLLCPSRSLRRKTRVVLAFLAIVALLAWNAGHRSDPDGARSDTDGAFAVAHDEVTQFNAETARAVGETTGVKTADRPRPLEGSRTTCYEDALSYIDGKCSVGTARKLPRPRAANETPTIAALPIGRSALPSAESSEAPLSATDAHAAEPAPAVADRAVTPAPIRKKVQKPPHRNSGYDLARDWRWRDDQRIARAYAPDDRYLRDRYERPWGLGPIR